MLLFAVSFEPTHPALPDRFQPFFNAEMLLSCANYDETFVTETGVYFGDKIMSETLFVGLTSLTNLCINRVDFFHEDHPEPTLADVKIHKVGYFAAESCHKDGFMIAHEQDIIIPLKPQKAAAQTFWID